MADIEMKNDDPYYLNPTDIYRPYDIYDPEGPPELPKNWGNRGLCVGLDPNIFFPEKEAGPNKSREQVTEAKSYCNRCPVQYECLAYALMHRTKQGVWGGKTVEERGALVKRRNIWMLCHTCGNHYYGMPGMTRCCNQGTRK